MPKMKRVLSVVGIILVVCVLYVAFLGPQTLSYLGAHYVGQKVPIVNETPSPLQDKSISAAKGTTLTYFGYELRFPGMTSTKSTPSP